MSCGVGGLPSQVGPGRNMEGDRTRLPVTRAGGLRREMNLQIRFSPAWERLALASAMAVFLVGLAALDGNAKERFVTVHGQAEEVQEGAGRANDNL